MCIVFILWFKQKTAYERRISDWSSDMCSSELFMDQDLDPRLELVVAATVAVVNPEARLGIGDELSERDEGADARRDHRCAAHTATDMEGSAQLAGVIAHEIGRAHV